MVRKFRLCILSFPKNNYSFPQAAHLCRVINDGKMWVKVDKENNYWSFELKTLNDNLKNRKRKTIRASRTAPYLKIYLYW